MFRYEELPRFNVREFSPQLHKYCVCIPVINEGEKIKKQLEEMKMLGLYRIVDIIVCDGGSFDGSLEDDFLLNCRVSLLLTKQDTGKLSAQLRMGYYYALVNRHYDGIITVDGNNKDSMINILNFVKKLDEGYDFVQGSRFIEGGKAINTPLIRYLAIKLIHIPFISWLAGFKYTDTTNGFRAYSRKFLLDIRVEPFRKIFDSYELLAYLSVKAPRLGYKVIEVPVARRYPRKGRIPTKISFVKGNAKLLKILMDLFLKRYEPK